MQYKTVTLEQVLDDIIKERLRYEDLQYVSDETVGEIKRLVIYGMLRSELDRIPREQIEQIEERG